MLFLDLATVVQETGITIVYTHSQCTVYLYGHVHIHAETRPKHMKVVNNRTSCNVTWFFSAVKQVTIKHISFYDDVFSDFSN